MSKLFDSVTTKDLTGENGMLTHSTSGSFVVDLFFQMGGIRSGRKDMGSFLATFHAAYGENPNLTLKALFNLRDIRGGMGERDLFKILIHSLANAHPGIVRQLVHQIPEYGRWDDLFALLDTPVEKEALEVILNGLRSGNALCGKWMPRENKSEGHIAKYLMQKFGLSPKEYRERVVAVTHSNGLTTETQMCQQMWESIKFQSVPAQAMKKYRKAFGKHQEQRFAEFLEKAKKGEVKINTATLSPVQIVHSYLTNGNRAVDDALEAQWINLPDTVPANVSFLTVCDVSPSMTNPNNIPMEVSLSLGIYLAQRNKSIFKNGVITFHETPQLVRFTGRTLLENLRIVQSIPWGGSTNLQGVFQLILRSAVQNHLTQEDLPTHLMVISDMQFNQAFPMHGSKVNSYNTALEMIDHMYREAGYQRPNIFFWNVATASGVPAKMDDNGVGLISGFSPNLLTSVLSGDLNPIRQIEAILNSGRYDFVNEIVK